MAVVVDEVERLDEGRVAQVGRAPEAPAALVGHAAVEHGATVAPRPPGAPSCSASVHASTTLIPQGWNRFHWRRAPGRSPEARPRERSSWARRTHVRVVLELGDRLAHGLAVLDGELPTRPAAPARRPCPCRPGRRPRRSPWSRPRSGRSPHPGRSRLPPRMRAGPCAQDECGEEEAGRHWSTVRFECMDAQTTAGDGSCERLRNGRHWLHRCARGQTCVRAARTAAGDLPAMRAGSRGSPGSRPSRSGPTCSTARRCAGPSAAADGHPLRRPRGGAAGRSASGA